MAGKTAVGIAGLAANRRADQTVVRCERSVEIEADVAARAECGSGALRAVLLAFEAYPRTHIIANAAAQAER